MLPSHTSVSTPRRRRSPAASGALAVGWLLLAAWVALVAWNISLAGLRAPLTRMIALPGLPLRPNLATLAAVALAALMAALLLILTTLTLAPFIARSGAPTPLATSPTRSSLALGKRRRARAARARTRFTPLVYISHSSQDEAFGQRLAADLHAALTPVIPGRVWYDTSPDRGLSDIAQPGVQAADTHIPPEILDQITTRNVFIVILSPAATRSRWVKREIEQAMSRYNGPERFAVYPVVYRDCALPKPLSIFQKIDFTQADTNAATYRALLDELVSLIREGRVDLSESAPPFDLGLLPEPPQLIGRDAELAWALARLRKHETTALTTLRDMGGVGKSALAAVAIRRLRQERPFPDGIAVIPCANQTDPIELLRKTLSRFAPGRRMPDADDSPGLTSIARQLLAKKRTLIVLDNIEPGWPIEQVTGPLTAAGATLLLTARQMSPSSAVPQEGVRRLDSLLPDDALLLLAQSDGYDSADTLPAEERDAAERIVTLLERHALAIRLVGAYAVELDLPLARVAEEIANDLLRIPDGQTERKIEATLTHSVDSLPSDGQRLFAALAAFATGEFGRQAAHALARSLALANPDAVVELLVRRALLDTSVAAALPAENADTERLRLHPLLQAEAKLRLALWANADRSATDRAIAAWYAEYCNAVDVQGGLAYLALAPDEENILGALERAQALGDDTAIARICNGMRAFWHNTARTRAAQRWLPMGAQAARRVAARTQERDDLLRAARINNYYADLLSNTGRFIEAEQIYERDLAVRRRVGDLKGEGATLTSLGQVALRRGRLEEATGYFSQGLHISREIGDRNGEAADLANLGQTALRRGRLDDAATFFAQSLPIRREVGDRHGEAADLANLGQVALAYGQPDEAAAYFARSLLIRREIDDRAGEAADLACMGQVALAHGRLDEAADYFAQSLPIRREVGDQRGESVDLASMGQVALRRGRLEKAAAYFAQSLPIRREVGDQRGEGAVLSNLGQVALTRGRLEEAEDYFAQSLPIRREVDDQQGEAVDLASLGQVALARGRPEDAEAFFAQSLPIRREVGDRHGEAAVLLNLGQVALARGQLEQAETLFTQSLSIRREISDQQGVAVDQVNLGQVAEARGQYAEAAQAYRAGITALRVVGDQLNVATTLELLGSVLLQHSDDHAGGCAAFAEASALWQEVGLADRKQAASERARELGCGEARQENTGR